MERAIQPKQKGSAITQAGTTYLIGNIVSIGGGVFVGCKAGKAIANATDSTGWGIVGGIASGIVTACVGSAITNQIVIATCGERLKEEACEILGLGADLIEGQFNTAMFQNITTEQLNQES